MVNKSNQIKGIYFAIATAFISGISIFVNKFAVGAITPPLVFTTAKNVGVGLLIMGIIIGFGKWKKLKKISKKDFYYLLLIGIIGGSIPFYLFFTGLSMTPAINAAIIQKTLVFWIIILAIPFLKEKLSKLQFLAIILLFLGNLTIGGFKGFLFSQGELMIFAATIFWAIENILAKKILPRIDPDILTAARMGFGSIILLITSQILAPKGLANIFHLSNIQLLWMTLTVISLLAYVMTWYRALKFAPVITVASILVTATLVTNVLSAVFITHAWTKDMGIQSLIMLVGVGLFIFVTKRGLTSINSPKRAKQLG
jgi:drug/metabolite transporter (DMT)-like permease